MPADPRLLEAVRRVNLEGSLLALLVEGMNTHGADAMSVSIALGDDHEPADIAITFEREGIAIAGESL